MEQKHLQPNEDFKLAQQMYELELYNMGDGDLTAEHFMSRDKQQEMLNIYRFRNDNKINNISFEGKGKYKILYSKGGDEIVHFLEKDKTVIYIAHSQSEFAKALNYSRNANHQKGWPDTKLPITFLEYLFNSLQIVKGIDMTRTGDCKTCGFGVDQKCVNQHEETCFKLCNTCGSLVLASINNKSRVEHHCNVLFCNISFQCGSQYTVGDSNWNVNSFGESELMKANSLVVKNDIKGMCTECKKESNHIIKINGCIAENSQICHDCWISHYRDLSTSIYCPVMIKCPHCEKNYKPAVPLERKRDENGDDENGDNNENGDVGDGDDEGDDYINVNAN
jgi:hypothetical protein